MRPQANAKPRNGKVWLGGVVLLSAYVVAVVCGQRFGQAGASAAASNAAAADDVRVGADIDPSEVMGVAAGDCKKCHEASVAHWMTTSHFNSEKLLFADNAKKYASALGIAGDSIRKDSMCVRCHATVAADDDGGNVRAISGISCESCHGAAGGEDGWLNPHHVYGPNMTKRENETAEHRKMRIARIEKAGMIRPANTYELARNCFQCHLVGSEDLVGAGHKVESSGFELVSWLHGEVRHNYQLDPKTNAEAPSLWMDRTGNTPAQRKRMLYAAGILADLEASLRYRARATKPAYVATISGRIAAINGAKLPQLATIPEVAPVQGKIAAAFARLFMPKNDDEEYYTKLADEVAAAGRKFVENHDGSKLQALDAMIPPPKPKTE